MFNELSEIKILRKRLDLTQHELANKAGISQSLLAKIESGKIDPTYAKAKRIFETLSELSNREEVKASDIMNKKIVTAKPKEKIKQVIANMRKHGISQLPVVEDNNLLGFISESIILEGLLGGKASIVEEIMHERPPSVSKDSTLEIVSGLLKHYPMVAVFDKGKMIGIITKSDVIINLNK